MSEADLAQFRGRLDEIDEQIARLLGKRFDICREVAAYKSANDVPMMQPDRVEQVRRRYLARGAEVSLPADFTESLFELMIGATCKLEDELMAELAQSGAAGSAIDDGAMAKSAGARSAAAEDGSDRRR